MINLGFALTLINGFLLISNVEAVFKNKNTCTAIAVFLHFSLFSTLLWTSVEASYVCIGIVAVILFLKYCFDFMTYKSESLYFFNRIFYCIRQTYFLIVIFLSKETNL